MRKLSDVALVVEGCCAPYRLIEIRATAAMLITIEHVGDDEVSAQSRFAINLVDLAMAVDWRDLVKMKTQQAVADLDRFLKRDAVNAAAALPG